MIKAKKSVLISISICLTIAMLFACLHFLVQNLQIQFNVMGINETTSIGQGGGYNYSPKASSLTQSDDGYYEINDVRDLRNIEQDLAGKYRLMVDLDIGGPYFKPIGGQVINASLTNTPTSVIPFTGVFDGNGHTIKNLIIKNPDNLPNNLKGLLYSLQTREDASSRKYRAYAGLFGIISDATIKNLMIENVTIDISYSSLAVNFNNVKLVNTSVWAGIIAGGVEGSKETILENICIKNYSISVNNRITADTPVGSNAGGLIGCNTSNLTIRNCVLSNFAGGSMNIENTLSYIGGANGGLKMSVGGMVGQMNQNLTISNSYNVVSMYADYSQNNNTGGTNESHCATCVGGLVGSGYDSQMRKPNLSVNKCFTIISASSQNNNNFSYGNNKWFEQTSDKYLQPVLGWASDGSYAVITTCTECYYNGESSKFVHAGVNEIKSGNGEKSLDWFTNSGLDFLNGN